MIFQHNQPNNILTWSNASLLKAWYSRYDHYTTLLCSMSALNCFIIIEIDTPKLSLLLQTSTDLISVLCVSVKLVLGWQRTLKQTCWWHCPGPGNDPSRHGGVERWSRCDNNAMHAELDWSWLTLTMTDCMGRAWLLDGSTISWSGKDKTGMSPKTLWRDHLGSALCSLPCILDHFVFFLRDNNSDGLRPLQLTWQFSSDSHSPSIWWRTGQCSIIIIWKFCLRCYVQFKCMSQTFSLILLNSWTFSI